jgi:hypothetical protein
MKKTLLIAFSALLLFSACKKDNTEPSDTSVTPKDTIPNDPSLLSTQGFFFDNWQPKSFTIPSSVTEATLPASTNVTVTVNTATVISKMPATIFGNNSNVWIGQINTEGTLMNHLTNLQPRILRGPAGSVSDVYFFNASAAPSDVPATLLNADGTTSSTGYWYGKNTQSWTFSVDGYYDMLLKTGSKGMLTVNYGYARYGTSDNPVAAAAHLAADWVRYDKGRTPYWEVGNEVYGEWEAGYRIDTKTNKDGQPEIITGALYGKHFKVFADSMRKAAAEIGVPIKIGAVLYESEPQSWNTNTIKTWNAGYFSEAGNTADFYSVHSYFTPYNENSTAATIFNSAATVPAEVMAYVKKTMTAAGVNQKPIAMTEWNTFASGGKQNVSHVVGMHAVLTLSEFVKNGYGAALRWDIANGWSNGDDHGMFSMGDEPDGIAKWNPRPAFFHMYYYQRCTGDRMLASTVTASTDVAAYATSFTSGEKAVVLVNKGTGVKNVAVDFQYFTPGGKVYWYTLTGGSDNGEFSRMVYVNGVGPENGKAGGPLSYATLKMNAASAANGVKLSLPARSVVFAVVAKK